MKKISYLFLAVWIFLSTYCLITTINAADKKIDEKKREIKKFKLNFYLYSSWLDAKRRGRSIEDYLQSEHIHTVAIYGMGDVGIKFCKELQKTQIKIKYVLDQNISTDTLFAPVVRLDEKLPPVDAIIVTPINVYSQIKECLSIKTESKIISAEDIIFNL